LYHDFKDILKRRREINKQKKGGGRGEKTED
jgi:hypothetical protein